jgi:alpha-ketoglutarate-dependent taurine dioxygenase
LLRAFRQRFGAEVPANHFQSEIIEEIAMPFEDDDNDLTQARPIVGAPFGWEVRVDLSALPPADVREALVRIFKRDGLILFRNQSLSMDQQLDVCEIFGPVLRGGLDNYIVSNVAEGGLLGHRELDFHNDVPFVPIPFMGGSLHALEVAQGVANSVPAHAPCSA